MPDSSDKQRSFLEKRRSKTEHIFKDPWHRRIARVFETAGKKASLRLLGKMLRITPVKGYLPFDEIKSVLFLRADGIGDAIVTTPLWRALKKRRPDLVIGVAGSFRNIPILEQDPNISHTYDFADPDPKRRRAEIARAQAMHYDLVFGCTFHRTTKTAIQARRASRHGYTAYMMRGKPNNRVYLFSKIVFREGGANLPMVTQLQYMLEQTLGITLVDDERMPEIHIPAEVREKIAARLSELLKRTGSSRVVVVNTESATPFREWGFDKSCELARKLAANHADLHIALISSPASAEALAQYIKDSKLPPTVSYFPTANIFEAAALLEKSELLISPDTATIHVANALRKPIIGFYLKDNEWKPYEVPSYVFITEEEQPIATIPVEGVLKAANDLLDANSATLTKKQLHVVKPGS